jgi:hypothetical protein
MGMDDKGRNCSMNDEILFTFQKLKFHQLLITSIGNVQDIMLYIMQIDVENPCVIMSQDKSREFLHSGNEKDKFKVTSNLIVCLFSARTNHMGAVLTSHCAVLFQGYSSSTS